MYRDGAYTSSIISYMYSTPPNTVTRYPMKEGSDIVFYGNRPEQRNPAALIDRGGQFKALEDNVSINIAPRWEVIPKLILRGQYSYRVSSSATNRQRAAYNFFDYTSGALLETWSSINNASKDRSSYYYVGATAEYTFEKDKHRLFVIGGYNQELTNNGDWDQWSLYSAKLIIHSIVVSYWKQLFVVTVHPALGKVINMEFSLLSVQVGIYMKKNS